MLVKVFRRSYYVVEYKASTSAGFIDLFTIQRQIDLETKEKKKIEKTLLKTFSREDIGKYMGLFPVISLSVLYLRVWVCTGKQGNEKNDVSTPLVPTV